MTNIQQSIAAIRHQLPQGVRLLCVSKYQPEQAILAAYQAGERDFGESRVQELCLKYEHLPKDIRWHMIGHLQTNKIRPIIGFIDTIQSVDSEHLLAAIDREAARAGRRVRVYIEVRVAHEESKSGMSEEEYLALLPHLNAWQHIEVAGLMTMATNTDDEKEIRRCFRRLADLAKQDARLSDLSMGMSDDWPIAVQEGSTMVRVGSSIFGERPTNATQ